MPNWPHGSVRHFAALPQTCRGSHIHAARPLSSVHGPLDRLLIRTTGPWGCVSIVTSSPGEVTTTTMPDAQAALCRAARFVVVDTDTENCSAPGRFNACDASEPIRAQHGQHSREIAAFALRQARHQPVLDSAHTGIDALEQFVAGAGKPSGQRSAG